MENNVDYTSLGIRIRNYRNKLNMTQDKFAEKIGSSVQYISVIENGHSKPALPTIINIANALGVTVDQLLRDSIENNESIYMSDIAMELKDCSIEEIKFITEMVKQLKEGVRRYSP